MSRVPDVKVAGRLLFLLATCSWCSLATCSWCSSSCGSHFISTYWYFVSPSDGELWPDQELPGPGGDLHHPDDHPVSHRGEEGHHRAVQLRPRDDPRGQVTDTHTHDLQLTRPRANGVCVCVCAVTVSTPGWVRWSWTMRTRWRSWWKSLFPTERWETRDALVLKHVNGLHACANDSPPPLSPCLTRWSASRWFTPGGTCQLTSGGTHSCCHSSLLRPPCWTQPSQTRWAHTHIETHTHRHTHTQTHIDTHT